MEVIHRDVVEDVVDHDRVFEAVDQVSGLWEMGINDDVLPWNRLQGRDDVEIAVCLLPGGPWVYEVGGMPGSGEGLNQKVRPLVENAPGEPRREVDDGAQRAGLGCVTSRRSRLA